MVKDNGHPDQSVARYPRGVSVIICCHNAARRLVPTLQHLAAQDGAENIPWEILVVDNASTDGTAELARSQWPTDHRMPLRVIPENRMGLSYARAAGLAAARYEYISFVDDDNWVCPRWIETVVQVLDQDSQVGACIGAVEPVFETEAPQWFERYRHHFAAGHWGSTPKYTGFMEIWGAGLSLRHTAWQQLRSAGFSALLMGRRGKGLTCGEDNEICAALTLLGWKLWYDPRLQLRHFMPSARLRWDYLRRLWRGSGHASLALDWYHIALSGETAVFRERSPRGWARNLFRTAQKLLRSRRALLAMKEGDHCQLQAEYLLGRVQFLMSGFLIYRRGMRHVERFLSAVGQTGPEARAALAGKPELARPVQQ